MRMFPTLVQTLPTERTADHAAGCSQPGSRSETCFLAPSRAAPRQRGGNTTTSVRCSTERGRGWAIGVSLWIFDGAECRAQRWLRTATANGQGGWASHRGCCVPLYGCLIGFDSFRSKSPEMHFMAVDAVWKPGLPSGLHWLTRSGRCG